MKYDHVFEKYRFVPQSALRFGFEVQGQKYIYKTAAKSGIYLTFVVDEAAGVIEVNAIDSEFNEVYQPFEVKNSGAFAEGLRAVAQERLQVILDECFEDICARGRVLAYLRRKHGTEADYPFSDDDQTAVLRCENRKWYGIIMSVTYRQLGIDSDEPVDVMNIKLPPEKICALIDGHNWFSCYHMNKKYWVSVALTENVDFGELTALIDESYSIVSGKKA